MPGREFTDKERKRGQENMLALKLRKQAVRRIQVKALRAKLHTAEEIAKIMNVSIRTIYSDLKAIKDLES